MDQTDDGKYERPLDVDGVTWTVRLMPFGEEAHYHQPGRLLKVPRNGLLFTSSAGRRFREGQRTPERFLGMSSIELQDHFRRATPEG